MPSIPRIGRVSILNRAASVLAVLLTLFDGTVATGGDLAREARALLSDRCFACHGPDNASREADLRLDREEVYLEGEDSVVSPGDASTSELIRRIRSDDPYEQMPPPESHLDLSEAEVKTLVEWVDAGAPWIDHWAFVPPKPANLLDQTEEDSNPIDLFVRKRLPAVGLQPSPPADKRTLLRRVTLDLTGLPPTVDELERFLADESPGAYERVVDRLLASPRFGERMAIDWLDAARYADSYGYQNDRLRRVWPWRDWVVRSINENQPYDEFLTWQLAGDLLPEATPEQRLATAFSRLHRETNEGGSLPREFRAENVADRVNTLGAAVLGLTLECARCHDHKFDPISQRDYYALTAYFDNIGELGLYSHYTDATPTPALALPSDEQTQELAALERSIAELEANLGHLDAPAKRLTPLPNPPPASGEYSLEALSGDEKFVGEPQQVPGVKGRGLKFDGEDGWTGPHHAKERSEPFSLALWVRPAESEQDGIVVHRSRAWLDAAGRGYQLTLDKGRPAFALIHFWPGDAAAVRSTEALPADVWTHVAVTYDGSSRADGMRLYINGVVDQTETLSDSLTRTIRYAEGDLMPDKGVRLTLGHRFRDTGFAGGSVDELMVYDTKLTPPEVVSLAGSGAERLVDSDWAENHLLRSNPEAIELAADLQKRRAERDALRDAIPQIAVMAERKVRTPSYVLERGSFDARGDEVTPSPPETFTKDDSSVAPDRLALARWVTDPKNPLTARVAVNRLWQTVFGRGIVATPNDFGSQGAAPSHPDLLDSLAVRFVESGWDTKAMVRLMVMSKTYRQSSVVDEGDRAIDPDNVWLARGSSSRLSAEMLRDSALAVSGLLVEQVGGPPVHPFQPAGLWEEKGAARYTRDVGAGSHRRSLYTIWKRTSPPPAMMTFDAADREVCSMRRQATATPLQALVLLNDPQYVEAACGLADRLEEGPLDVRLAELWQIVTGREPSHAETAILQRLYGEQLNYLQDDPGSAAELLSVGDRTHANPTPEAAAMACTALGVLNHDAFVTKR